MAFNIVTEEETEKFNKFRGRKIDFRSKEMSSSMKPLVIERIDMDGGSKLIMLTFFILSHSRCFNEEGKLGKPSEESTRNSPVSFVSVLGNALNRSEVKM